MNLDACNSKVFFSLFFPFSSLCSFHLAVSFKHAKLPYLLCKDRRQVDYYSNFFCLQLFSQFLLQITVL